MLTKRLNSQYILAGLLLCLAESAHSQSRLQTLSNPGTQGAVNLQTVNLGVWRSEFRLENLTVQPATRFVWGVGAFPVFSCNITAGTLTLTCQYGGDGTPQGTTSVDLTNRRDARIRWQRVFGSQTIQIEVWNGDCTNYSSKKLSVTNPVAPQNYSGLLRIADQMQMSFLRIYDSQDVSGACPIDAPDEKANILDLRFENLSGATTLSDSSGRNQTATVPGASFFESQTYRPIAVIGGVLSAKPVFAVGETIRLSATSSVVFSGNGKPTNVFWNVIPPKDVIGQILINSNTDLEPEITILEPGEYTVRLTVNRGSAQEGTADLTMGLVGGDDAFVVTAGKSADHSAVLGKLMIHGRSAWPWYDTTEAAVVDALRPLMIAPPTETLGAGTVRASTTRNRLDGNGRITSEGTGNSGVYWEGVGTSFDSTLEGQRIVIRWDADDDGKFNGRRAVFVSKVLSATAFISNDYYLPEPAAKFNTLNLQWARLGADFGPYNSTDPSSFILMFYEAGLGVGRFAAKTGLTVYRDQFHKFCDNWWRYGLGSGWAFPIPRNSGLHSMIACASDPDYKTKPAGMWDGIARITSNVSGYLSTTTGTQPGISPTTPVITGTIDVREQSYILRSTALLARFYGRAKNNPVLTQQWCGYLRNQVNNIWLSSASVPPGAPSNDYGFFPENLFINNVTYVAASSPAGAASGVFGTSPWRSAGLPNLALIYSYEALNDTEACNDPVLAAKLYDNSAGANSGLISRVANYIWDYGRSADGGVFYAEGYETDTGNLIGGLVYNDFPQNGFVRPVNGSTTLVGGNTYFRAQFGPCDGTTRISIIPAGSQTPLTYNVMSCASDTTLQLSAPYAGPTEVSTTAYSNPSSIAVVNGSATVTGTGTKFRTLFAPCDGTTYIGIVGKQNQFADRRVYQVTACASDSSLTLNLPYAGTTESGITWYSRAVKAQQNCGPQSISTRCEPDRYNGRNLSADLAASAAWLYSKRAPTGEGPEWKDRAIYYLNKSFGGAADGSGALGSPRGYCVYRRPGSVATTAGSTTITGTDTNFTSQFQPCNGTKRITIADAAGTWRNPPSLTAQFYTYSVMSCTDTSLTINRPWEGATRAATSLFYSPEDPQWQCADGGTGNLGEVLPPCQSQAPPCGDGALVPKYGKPLGMAAGAGDTPLAFAYVMQGPVVDQAKTVQVLFNKAAVPNAVNAKITLISPNGAKSENTCSSSPCELKVNLRLGNPQVVIDYLDGTGSKILAHGEPAVLRVVSKKP